MTNPIASKHDGGFPASADAPPGNWVDRWAPAAIAPYLRLARADRPIGAWLLLWPCWWSLAMASIRNNQTMPDLWYLALFAIGAFVMRGAGCTYNDIVDRDIDGRVARTRTRPIPSGEVSVRHATFFMLALSLTGFLVLVQFNWFAIGLGIASLGLVALYPFMKRITSWPQAVLGLAFSWGALMGWAVVFGALSAPAVVLYIGAVAWTIGYDTIYAHQDADDDALIGLKSTALRFGKATKPWLWGFYGVAWGCILLAGLLAGAGFVFIAGMVVAGAHLIWQITTLNTEHSANCLTRFRANRDFGALVFAAILLDLAVATMV